MPILSLVGFVLVAMGPPAGFTHIPDIENNGCGVEMGESLRRGIRGVEALGEFGLIEGDPSVDVCSSFSEEEVLRV